MSRNNNTCWINKNGESDEESWIDEYSTETDSSYIYVNNMNAKNNSVKTKEVVLAGLQGVIDMCTPQESISDVVRNPISNDDVIDWVEKEFLLLEEELKKSTVKKQEQNIAKRKGMLKGIRNLVHRKSQLDMEAGVIETVNSKNEIMIMSFVRPEIVPTNQNRLRAGARGASSRMLYSKYSQTSNLNEIKKIQSKTQATQTQRDQPDNSVKPDVPLKSLQTTFRTDSRLVSTSSSSTRESYTTFSSSSKSGSTETGCDSESAGNSMRYLCSSCAENDALPLNTKVSTMSTNNLKVIHISLGTANRSKENVEEAVCFKCLKDKEVNGKRRTRKLCLNDFVEITGKHMEEPNILKLAFQQSKLREENLPSITNKEKSDKTENSIEIIKSAKTSHQRSIEKKVRSTSMESMRTLKTLSICETCGTNPTVTHSNSRLVKKNLDMSSQHDVGLKECVGEVQIAVLNAGAEKQPTNNDPLESGGNTIATISVKLNSSNKSSYNNSISKKDVESPVNTSSSSKSVEPVEGATEDAKTQETNLSLIEKRLKKHKVKRKRPSEVQCLLAVKKDAILSLDDLIKQKAALESIKESNETEVKDASVSNKTSVKIASQRTIIVSDKSSIKTYHVQTPHYLGLNKGAHGDIPSKVSRRKTISQDSQHNTYSILEDSNLLNNEEHFKCVSSEDHTGKRHLLKNLNETMETSCAGSGEPPASLSDDGQWKEAIPEISKQLTDLFESQSEDSLKTQFINLNVENPEGIDIDSEKVSMAHVCQLKSGKRFGFFGHASCDCEACVKSRPVEIRYATTKISKFQRYSTFEIFKSSKCKPKFMSATTESVFVMKNKNLP